MPETTSSRDRAVTPAEEEYLEAIYRLAGGVGPVPLSSVAEYLAISPVSANEKVRRMEDKQFVSYEPYVGVALTDRGRERAEAVLRRHRLWERMLVDILHVPWEDVHAEACRLEHATSDLVERHLADLLEEPTTCPHGHLMPGGAPATERGVALTALDVGQCATIVAVTVEDSDFLHSLAEIGLVPGAEVRVAGAEPALRSITVESGEEQITMAHEIAKRIMVVGRVARDE